MQLRGVRGISKQIIEDGLTNRCFLRYNGDGGCEEKACSICFRKGQVISEQPN
jgi:hypothetical protein